MEYPRVKKRKTPLQSSTAPRVYTDLDDLIRLQYKARGFSFLPRQPVSSILAGRHASRLRGRGLNFEEIRGYLPGDDIRNIDWKVTARLGEAHVRVYTEEKDRPTLLLIDQRKSMFFGSQGAMKSVIAAETAAIAAWKILDSGDRVGAIVFNDQDLFEFKPHRSEARVMQVLRKVVDLNHQLNVKAKLSFEAGQPINQLNRVVEAASRLAQHDYLVILISDCEGADEDSRRRFTRICQHNDAITAFVFDPLESKMANVGPAVVSDGELQLELDTSNRKLRDEFDNQYQTRIHRARNFALTRSMPLLLLSTHEDVAEQIRKQIGAPIETPRQ